VLPTPGRIFQPGWPKQAAAVNRKEDIIKMCPVFGEIPGTVFGLKKVSASVVKTIKTPQMFTIQSFFSQ
jgi:hypothetical protein